MTKAFIFWLLMLLWLIFGTVWLWPAGPAVSFSAYGGVGLSWLSFVLFALLGWQAFGSPVKG
jgi:hypothetical protein